MTLSLIGTIDVNPYKPGIKNNPPHRININIHNGFMDYYRHMYNMSTGIKLRRPNHNCHVTALKRNTFDWKQAKRKYQGKKVKIFYNNFVRYSGDIDKNAKNFREFFFINCWSNDLIALQKELNHPIWKNLHITIGKLKNKDVGQNKLYGKTESVHKSLAKKGFYMRDM